MNCLYYFVLRKEKGRIVILFVVFSRSFLLRKLTILLPRLTSAYAFFPELDTFLRSSHWYSPFEAIQGSSTVDVSRKEWITNDGGNEKKNSNNQRAFSTSLNVTHRARKLFDSPPPKHLVPFGRITLHYQPLWCLSLGKKHGFFRPPSVKKSISHEMTRVIHS